MTKQNKISFETAKFLPKQDAKHSPLLSVLVAMQSNDPQQVKRSGADVQNTLKQVSAVLSMMSDLLEWTESVDEARRCQLIDGMTLMASLSELCSETMTQVEYGWFVESNPKAAAQIFEFSKFASGRTARGAVSESDESEGGGHDNE